MAVGILKWRLFRSQPGVYLPHNFTAHFTLPAMPLALGPEQLYDRALATALLDGADTSMVVVPLWPAGYAGSAVVGVMACKRTSLGKVDKLIVSDGKKYSMRSFLHAGGTRSNCWESCLRVAQVSAARACACQKVLQLNETR